MRTRMLVGDSGVERLERAHVAVFGVGGVGSYAAEALARAGVGRLTLVDFDTVGETNLNRQLAALNSTLGQYKAQVMADRARDINPQIRAEAVLRRYVPEERENFFREHYTYVVDAIDLVTCKLDLILTCRERGIPVISAMGTGNKFDVSQLRVTDLEKTRNCPLAKVMRRELRKRGLIHHQVVYSPELPAPSLQLEAPPPGRRSVPASIPWVPGAAGLMLAGEVVRQIAEDRLVR